MIVVVSDLEFNAGADFAVALHGSAVVSARLVIATQVAVVVGAAVLMVAIEGSFVVVVVRVRFQFSLITRILATFLVGMVSLWTVQRTGYDESLLVLLRTLP